ANPQYVGLDSTLILDEQIPGRPLHTANLTIDALHAPSGIEFLANAHYVGANNNQFIAPYTLVNAGVSHNLGIGRLTLFASNLFNTEAGNFSTLQYAEPIPLSGGGTLVQAARPNAPRAYTVTYSLNTGARPGAGFSRGSRTASSGTGNAAATRQQGGFFGFGQFKFVAPPAGTDPLTIATVRPECTGDLQPQAQTALVALKAAADAYASGAPLPEVPGVTVTPHGDPKGTWYFGLGPSIPESALPQRPPGDNPRGAGGQGGFGPRVGGEPTGPGGFQQRVVVAPNPSASARPEFSPSPALLAALQPFRALASCSYGTVFTPEEAKARGYDVPVPGTRPVAAASPTPAPSASPGPGNRARRFGGGNFLDYAPGIGIFVVRPPELGTGGGSVKH
ncbi:MAG: hypothetical protein JOZ24_00445, partial [Candidatus Eremiobacteraeota bacterium]|nr:hypothetical protein [Candidatus Eremiobacteraeota bacterium]